MKAPTSILPPILLTIADPCSASQPSPRHRPPSVQIRLHHRDPACACFSHWPLHQTFHRALAVESSAPYPSTSSPAPQTHCHDQHRFDPFPEMTTAKKRSSSIFEELLHTPPPRLQEGPQLRRRLLSHLLATLSSSDPPPPAPGRSIEATMITTTTASVCLLVNDHPKSPLTPSTPVARFYSATPRFSSNHRLFRRCLPCPKPMLPRPPSLSSISLTEPGTLDSAGGSSPGSAYGSGTRDDG